MTVELARAVNVKEGLLPAGLPPTSRLDCDARIRCMLNNVTCLTEKTWGFVEAASRGQSTSREDLLFSEKLLRYPMGPYYTKVSRESLAFGLRVCGALECKSAVKTADWVPE